MKKIYIFLLIFLLSIFLSPIIGHYTIENLLTKKIDSLSSKNITLIKEKTENSYLSTKKEYQFLYTDADEEILIGVDVLYSNLLLNKTVNIDLYPISISKKKLENKALLIHLQYNLLKQKFKGYLKDIEQLYTLKDSTQIFIKIFHTKFNGDGQLKALNNFKLTSKNIAIKISKGSQITELKIDNLFSSIKHTGRDKTLTTADTSSDSISFYSADKQIQFQDINYSVTFNEIDKKALLQFQKNISQDKDAIKQNLLHLLSKGIQLSINNFSFKNIILDTKNLGSLKLKSKLDIKKSSNIITLTKNISTDIQLQISKKIFKKMRRSFSAIYLLRFYAKTVDDNYYFHIKYSNTNLEINGKGLRF